MIINSKIEINKKSSNVEKLFILQVAFFLIKILNIVFVGSMVSSQVTTESSIMLPKYSFF